MAIGSHFDDLLGKGIGMNEVSNQDSTWKKSLVPRGKNHSKTASKTTVSLYLNKNLVENARKHRLNLSKITEQALNSILDYLAQQNTPESSISFLGEASFPKGSGPVDQSGMIAAFARRKPRVQIPPGPLMTTYGFHTFP